MHFCVGPVNFGCKKEITIARQKEYMAGLKDDIETDKKEKEEVGCQDCWTKKSAKKKTVVSTKRGPWLFAGSRG